MAILEVNDIHTYYGDAYVLQGLSIALEQGQILGLLGRNGVGKTTLVNSIVGFNPPRRGKIVFKGDDITQKSSFETVRTGMGLVPQGRRVFPTLERRGEPAGRACAAPTVTAGGCSGFTHYSRALRSAAISAPRHCRAASSRCWRSAAR